MALSTWLLLLLTHPNEFRTLLQFKIWHEPKRNITAKEEHETSGWDRSSMRRCWDFLDMTSRSFSAVIKELEGDLARTVCLFYLVLRGLDTIEDDMTLPDELKQSLLRQFHVYTVTPGWNFDGSGPNEKDRQLLVEYDVVVAELNLLPFEYRAIILDICEKMAAGMADFAHQAYISSKSSTTDTLISLSTVPDYDLYCHYVAGLVGEGLSKLLSASGKEAPWLGDLLELSNSTGLLLQKTNIIRDFREDCDEGRFFWPREIWGNPIYLSSISHSPSAMNTPRDLCLSLESPQHLKQTALNVQSAMVLDAMRHLVDALDYLKCLKNQSVFNFVAIPVTMAIATLELCFMNEDMFMRNIKIRKAEAARLIMQSTNPREVAYIFRDYCRKIHNKAIPTDPSYLKISIACGKIEQWAEHHYPSFISISGSGSSIKSSMDPADPRSKVITNSSELDKQLDAKRRVQSVKKRVAERKAKIAEAGGDEKALLEAEKALNPTGSGDWEAVMYIAIAIVAVLGICAGVSWLLLTYVDGSW